MFIAIVKAKRKVLHQYILKFLVGIMEIMYIVYVIQMQIKAVIIKNLLCILIIILIIILMIIYY